MKVFLLRPFRRGEGKEEREEIDSQTSNLLSFYSIFEQVPCPRKRGEGGKQGPHSFFSSTTSP